MSIFKSPNNSDLPTPVIRLILPADLLTSLEAPSSDSNPSFDDQRGGVLLRQIADGLDDVAAQANSRLNQLPLANLIDFSEESKLVDHVFGVLRVGSVDPLGTAIDSSIVAGSRVEATLDARDPHGRIDRGKIRHTLHHLSESFLLLRKSQLGITNPRTIATRSPGRAPIFSSEILATDCASTTDNPAIVLWKLCHHLFFVVMGQIAANITAVESNRALGNENLAAALARSTASLMTDSADIFEMAAPLAASNYTNDIRPAMASLAPKLSGGDGGEHRAFLRALRQLRANTAPCRSMELRVALHCLAAATEVAFTAHSWVCEFAAGPNATCLKSGANTPALEILDILGKQRASSIRESACPFHRGDRNGTVS